MNMSGMLYIQNVFNCKYKVNKSFNIFYQLINVFYNMYAGRMKNIGTLHSRYAALLEGGVWIRKW